MDTAKQLFIFLARKNFRFRHLNFDTIIDRDILYKKYEFYRDIIIIDKLYE